MIALMRVTVMLMVMLVSGCSMLSPVQTSPKKTYVLSMVPPVTNKKPTRQLTLLVMLPESNAVYNTTDMAYTTEPYQVAYFANNGWAETPAKMLQPLIVQALQSTHYFKAIGTSIISTRYDMILTTQLLQLQQDFTNKNVRSQVHLVLRAQLINAATGRVIAARQFSAVEAAPTNNPYGGVIAANRAASVVMEELAAFCLRAI